jgi:cell division protease FtsH
VRRLVEYGHNEATRILTERRDDLETVAKGLIEYETLSGDEILGLLKGITPVRDDPDAAPPSGPSSAVPTIGRKPNASPEANPQPSA